MSKWTEKKERLEAKRARHVANAKATVDAIGAIDKRIAECNAYIADEARREQEQAETQVEA